MSALTIYSESGSPSSAPMTDPDRIAAELGAIGVRFERWQAECKLAADASETQILAAYRDPVERLKQSHGFRSADVISVGADHPDKEAIRQKFLAEHTHDDDEVRFFVAGRGLFYLHPGDAVYVVLCERGDLIGVPAGIRHWFDLGTHPDLQVIRLFSDEAGWVARFTGDPIASRFPTLAQYQTSL